MLCTLIYFVLLDNFGCLEQLHVGKLYGYCHLYGVFRLDARVRKSYWRWIILECYVITTPDAYWFSLFSSSYDITDVLVWQVILGAAFRYYINLADANKWHVKMCYQVNRGEGKAPVPSCEGIVWLSAARMGKSDGWKFCPTVRFSNLFPLPSRKKMFIEI